MVDWRIYYGDSTTYSNEDGSAFDAPADNVQAVVLRCPDHGRIVRSMKDFYWWVDDEWYAGDFFGLFDYLRLPGPKKVIFARSLSNQKFQAIMRVALTDTDFPLKNALAQEETF